MKTRRSSMVSIDTVTGPHSMTPNDTWVEVDGGKPTGNANSFPLDDIGSAQKEIIRQVNQNRNDITSLAASELVRIASSLVASSRVVEVMPMSDSVKVKAEQYLKERFEIEVVRGNIYVDTRDKIDAKTLGKELKKAGISVMTHDFKLAPPNHPRRLSDEESAHFDDVLDAMFPHGAGTDVEWTLAVGEYENEFGKIGSGS